MKRSFWAVPIVATMIAGGLQAGAPLDLKILHFNDHHGFLDQSTMKLTYTGDKGKAKKVYTHLGGLPRMEAEIKKLRNDHTLVLSAGDAFSGTLYHTLFHGLANVDLMNGMKLDAFTLGNHEFDNRDEGLKAFIDKANFPVVSANTVAAKGSLLDGTWKPYIVKEIGGEKIGIIGLEVGQKTKVSSRPSDKITFLDEVKTAQKYADELTQKGVDKIILLSHFGYDNDVKLAQQVSGIDVIIDGDSHTLMGNFSPVHLKAQVPDYPHPLTAKDGKPMCIAQAWAHAMVLGEVNVKFDANGTVVSCTGTPHLLIGKGFRQKIHHKKVDVNASTQVLIESVIAQHPNLDLVDPDPALQAKLDGYKKQVDAKKNNPIGKADEMLKHIRIPGHSYGGIDGSNMPLGSDIAPVVSKAFYEASKRADACIQNAGGVRITIHSGPVSYGTAYELLPFSNTLYEIDMKGSDIHDVLEDAISNYKDNTGGSTGSFPYAYGLRYDVDVSQPKGKRVTNIEIMDRKTKKWSPLDVNKTYVIVTNNYIAEGRDGYTTFKKVQQAGAHAVDTYLDYAESFVNYVKKLAAEGKGLTKLPKAEHCIKSYKE